jgi:hypothetical protein
MKDNLMIAGFILDKSDGVEIILAFSLDFVLK